MSFSLISNQPGYQSDNSWNWGHSNQSEIYFHKIQHRLFAYFLHDEQTCRNYMGLPLGLSYGALAAVSKICLIGEQVIKGLANLIGSPINDCDLTAKTGWKQLGLASKNSFYLLIGVPFVGALSLFVIPVMTFFSPETTKEFFMSTRCIPIDGEDPAASEPQNFFNENEVLTEFVF